METVNKEYEPVCRSDNTEVKVPVPTGIDAQIPQSNSQTDENSHIDSYKALPPDSQFICGNSDDVYLSTYN